MSLEIYRFIPAYSHYTLGLTRQITFKNTKVKLDLLTVCYKDIRGGIFIVISRYEKANNKHVKNYGKNKEPSYLNYWEVNN